MSAAGRSRKTQAMKNAKSFIKVMVLPAAINRLHHTLFIVGLIRHANKKIETMLFLVSTMVRTE
jgi:hypothetical protein